jgi:methionine-rich copper-binding protein CopC
MGGLHYKTHYALLLIVPLIVILLLVSTIPKSYAHAFVIKSNPSPSQSLTASPARVDVYFSEQKI